MTKISSGDYVAPGRLQHLADFQEPPDIAETADSQLNMGRGFYIFAPPPRSAAETQFQEMAYKYGWVLAGFAWHDWIITERGRALTENRGAIAEASEHELAQVITCLVRSGRFGENLLTKSLNNGFIRALVERAQILLNLMRE